MHRFALAFLLLAAATAVQAITPSRQDANGAGGNCPESDTVTVEEGDAVAPPEPAPAAAKAAAPPATKGGSVAKTRPGARWHSFLPGMFK